MVCVFIICCACPSGGYDRVECLKSVESYDPEWNIWASMESMREARGRFNIAVVRGEVYAVGGSNGTTELDTVEKYNQDKQKWTKVASLPLARSHTGKLSRTQSINNVSFTP